MLQRLRNWFSGSSAAPVTELNSQLALAPSFIDVPSTSAWSFDLGLIRWDGGVLPDEIQVNAWFSSCDQSQQAAAWLAFERGWLLHLRDYLGAGYRLYESENTLILSSQDQRAVNLTLDYMEKTLKRVLRTLDGIAEGAPLGKELLVVFEDEDSYYRYVAHFYPDEGEFAFSSGMCIHSVCMHYVMAQGQLQILEPIIAHEMTHGCLAHLPLPLWLNEGIAVNTEHRLTRVPPSEFTPMEMRQKHLVFWNEQTLAEFWSGESFQRSDDGNLLSYDLARLLVDVLARDWDSFAAFVRAADARDAGFSAANEYLGLDLGLAVSHLLAGNS